MTDVQKQCLLAALGYYPHREIDGIWGEKSRTAMAAFETANPGKSLPEAVAQIKVEEDFWSSIRHFTREEFRCRCGGKYCSGFPAEPDRTLVELIDQVRGDFDAPAIISSGLRCSRHNLDSGGVSNSRHLSGRAVDFMVLGVSGQTLYNRVKRDSRTRYAYIIGSGPYVHVDVK